MDDLTAFLKARLDEDEAFALGAIRMREAAVSTISPQDSAAAWSSGSDESRNGDYRQAVWAGDGAVTVCEMSSEYDEATAAHIARHDPAQVLREIEAKRSVVGLHRRESELDYDPICSVCCYAPPCDTLRWLAVPYSGHPDYRDEWWPTGVER